jgi:hypothetical protein
VIFTPRVSGGLFSQLLGALGGSSQYKKSTFLSKSGVSNAINSFGANPLKGSSWVYFAIRQADLIVLSRCRGV